MLILCVFVCLHWSLCTSHDFAFTKVKLKYSCTIHGSGHISGGYVNLKIDFVKQILEKKKKQSFSTNCQMKAFTMRQGAGKSVINLLFYVARGQSLVCHS